MGTDISDTWKPSDDEVKYLLPRTGSISSSLTTNFQIEREKCAHVEDLNEALTSKYAEIEMLVSKENNFFMDTEGQTSNILLDNGSKVESPKEHEFVCCQNELENAIAKTCLGMTISKFWPKISVILTVRKKSSKGEKMKAATTKMKGKSPTAKQDTMVLSVSTGRQRLFLQEANKLFLQEV